VADHRISPAAFYCCGVSCRSRVRWRAYTAPAAPRVCGVKHQHLCGVNGAALASARLPTCLLAAPRVCETLEQAPRRCAPQAHRLVNHACVVTVLHSGAPALAVVLTTRRLLACWRASAARRLAAADGRVGGPAVCRARARTRRLFLLIARHVARRCAHRVGPRRRDISASGMHAWHLRRAALIALRARTARSIITRAQRFGGIYRRHRASRAHALSRAIFARCPLAPNITRCGAPLPSRHRAACAAPPKRRAAWAGDHSGDERHYARIAGACAAGIFAYASNYNSICTPRSFAAPPFAAAAVAGQACAAACWREQRGVRSIIAPRLPHATSHVRLRQAAWHRVACGMIACINSARWAKSREEGDSAGGEVGIGAMSKE